jgi:hypothetical protein
VSTQGDAARDFSVSFVLRTALRAREAGANTSDATATTEALTSLVLEVLLEAGVGAEAAVAEVGADPRLLAVTLNGEPR